MVPIIYELCNEKAEYIGDCSKVVKATRLNENLVLYGIESFYPDLDKLCVFPFVHDEMHNTIMRTYMSDLVDFDEISVDNLSQWDWRLAGLEYHSWVNWQYNKDKILIGYNILYSDDLPEPNPGLEKVRW